jgi:hypothetical protein
MRVLSFHRLWILLVMLLMPLTSMRGVLAQDEVSFAISGRIVNQVGEPLANVRVFRSGREASVATNANGEYRFEHLVANTYSLVPRGEGFVFDPGLRRVTVSTGNATGINFVGVRAFAISGRIVNSEGQGVANVRVRRSGSDLAVLTNVNGEYRIPVYGAGTYTITPSLEGAVFDPRFRTVTVTTANIGAVNFVVARPATPMSISGRIVNRAGEPLASVRVFRSGSEAFVVTNSNGEYRFNNVSAGSYSITPRFESFLFDPPVRSVVLRETSVGNINFVGSRIYAVSGRVTSAEGQGVAGVRIRRNATDAGILTSSSGEFRLLVPTGTYTITPSKEGLRFEPATRTVTVSNSNVVDVNFRTFVPPTTLPTISGRVTNAEGLGVAGVAIRRTGSDAIVLTNAEGRYVLNVPAGTYILTPNKEGLEFDPIAISVTVATANVVDVNFRATAVVPRSFSITGRVTNGEGFGVAGVTIRRSGSEVDVVTNSEGRYVLQDVSAGTYTVTPQKEGLRFEPSARTVTVADSNVVDINFRAFVRPPTASFIITGRVTNGEGFGVAGVAIRRTGSDATVLTNSEGRYELLNVPAGTYTVTPSKEGLRFEPSTRSVTVSTSNVGDVHFRAFAAQ